MADEGTTDRLRPEDRSVSQIWLVRNSSADQSQALLIPLKMQEGSPRIFIAASYNYYRRAQILFLREATDKGRLELSRDEHRTMDTSQLASRQLRVAFASMLANVGSRTAVERALINCSEV